MIYNLKAAVIGSGAMGKKHLDILKECVGEVVLCTNDISTGKKITEENSLTFYSDYSEMFEKEKLDLVSVCLPTPLHYPATMKAIEHGVNVLCEKPFAQTAEQSKQMKETAEKKGITLMVGHCLRFSPPYEFLRRCISDNRYGKLLYLDFFRHTKKPSWSVGSWLADPAISGGVIRDLQIHNTDMVLNVLGMPKAIYSSGDTTVCRTVYKFENSNISVTASASFRNATFYIPFVGYDAVFENAVLTLQNNEFTLSTNDGLKENPLEKEIFPSFIDKNTDNGVKAEILYLCECLRDNKKPEMCLPEDSYKTMLISDAELESLNTKKKIEFL